MKMKGIKYFLQSFLLVFTILIFFSVLLSFAFFGRSGFSMLASAYLFSLPYLFYIFVFSCSISIVSTIRKFYSDKKELEEAEEYLHYLANEEFSYSLYQNLYDAGTFNPEMGSAILKIRKMLMELSKETQAQFKQDETTYQTKEDILADERKRIARELHDSVSQQLFAASMMLSAIDQQKTLLPEPFQNQIAIILQTLNESQSEMRALLLHLRPIKLEGKSLKAGIEQLLNELKTKTDIRILWKIEEIKADPAIENHLFRIVQELLSNTLRHAKAHLLEVYMNEKSRHIILKVVDDGKGFNVGQNKAGSYGLENIQERIAAMGGTVRILSFPGKGTSVEIRVPNIKEENA